MIKLPVSFEEVSYFNNEYRGDLIVTKGVLYYFPHTRVGYARRAEEIGGKDAMAVFELLGSFAPVFGAVPWLHVAADKSLKIGKFLNRKLRPTTNAPRIREINLWRGGESNETLQKVLDAYIEKLKAEKLSFDEDSVPKPMRFAAAEVENARCGLKFKFDAKYDVHDFKVNLMHLGLFKKSLREAGFLK